MKYLREILIASCIILPMIIFFGYIFFPWVILPTDSDSHTFTIVNYGGPSLKRITVKNDTDDMYINSYILDLKVEPHYQKPQTYEFPVFDEGMVNIDVAFGDANVSEENDTITVNYTNAEALQNKGLTVYTTANYRESITIDGFVYRDQYIYFISGKNEICYFKKAGSSEWLLVLDAPSPELFTIKRPQYSPIYYGWKENRWVLSPVKDEQ